MASMLDQLRELAAPSLVSVLSRQTGESESAVSKGLGAAVPAITSTIADRADDTGFMREVADLATNTAATPHPLERLSTPISSLPGVDAFPGTGGWLSTLFGPNLSSVTDSIAKYAGIRGSSAASLLSVGAPLVLGYIGRLMRSENLSVVGLADLFRGQRDKLAAAMPAGFHMPESADASYARNLGPVEGMERSRWSMPMVALLAILGIGGLIWWSNHRPTEMARVDVSQPADKAVGTTGVSAGQFQRTLPGNTTITIPAVGSAEDRLSMYLAGAQAGMTAVTLDRVAFDSDSADLTGEANPQIDNIATILHAYPRTTVTIAGYADGVGAEEANQALSQARAEAVAKRLMANGVASDRIRVAAYGTQKPIADNSTEAGRAQNRRVELQVIEP
jgi:outer membrane protein OmpA-like peptidoglycan-associated protein